MHDLLESPVRFRLLPLSRIGGVKLAAILYVTSVAANADKWNAQKMRARDLCELGAIEVL